MSIAPPGLSAFCSRAMGASESRAARAKVLCLVGTRPEAIKMAPVIGQLRKEDWVDVRVLATAQHRELLDDALECFGIMPDVDLDIMQSNQQLADLTSRLVKEIDEVLGVEKPDAVLIQGDTTTVMCASLACFYRRIPVGHVEAGLRTLDLYNPFPEEVNRVIVGRLATWHFCPTKSARSNLIREGVRSEGISVTGNTVIDALLATVRHGHEVDLGLGPYKHLVLVTCHRRESFGRPFRDICRALATVAATNPDVRILYPVHPNPNVSAGAYDVLGNIPNVTLCEPLSYVAFVAAMNACHFVISDSGGVQEEAPALGKPVLVLRERTERPEAVEEKVVKVIGTSCERIVCEAQRLLDDPKVYGEMSRGASPYGDGHAAERIVGVMRRHFMG